MLYWAEWQGQLLDHVALCKAAGGPMDLWDFLHHQASDARGRRQQLSADLT